MMEAVQDGKRDDGIVNRRVTDCRRGHRNALVDPLMRSGSIEIFDIGPDWPEQVPFVHDEQKVQALAPQATQEAFTAGIRARGSDRRTKDLDPGPHRHEVESWAVFVIVVADKIARTLVK